METNAIVTNHSFTIDKSYISKLLIEYYKGDNSLKNPVKLFIENESFDLDICRDVIQAINNNDVYFYIDLYLNDSVRYMIPGNKMPETKRVLTEILSGTGKGKSGKKRELIISNFFDSDLSIGDFDWIKDWADFDLDNADVRDLEKRLLMHKNYPIERKTIAYDLTQFEGFLPNEVQDIFLF